MGIVSTSTSKEQATIDAMLAIVEAVKNPGALLDSQKKLIEANTLSEARRAESEAAEKKIADAAKVLASLETKQSDYLSLVDTKNALLEKKQKEIEDSQANIDLQVKALNELSAAVSTQKIEFDKSVSAKNEEYKGLSLSYDLREKAIADSLKELKEREDKLNEREDKINEREIKVIDRETKLRNALE